MKALSNQLTTDYDIFDEIQAAALIGIEPRTLRLWRNTRGVPHYRLTSKVIRYRRGDLLAWMERSRVAITRGPARTGKGAS